MSIWTCKRAILLAAGLVLSGCATTGGFGFLTSSTPKPSNAIKAAVMADGAVTLTPPRGYCIDKSSLGSSFALIARCDTLGSDGNVSDVPLALITATLVPQETGAAAPKAADLMAVFTPEDVLQSVDRKGVALVQTNSATGLDGMSERHWRGAFAVNGVLVGLALYAPEDGPASGRPGAAILGALADRTKARSPARAASDTALATSQQGNTD